MKEDDTTASDAIEQAPNSAAYYLDQAYSILKEDYEDWSVRDAIELAKVLAQDFHTTMMYSKMENIKDEIGSIRHELNSIKYAVNNN